jgi:TatD DNase family protein
VLVDSHAHVQARQFDADRAQVLAAALAAGIGQVVVPGTDLESSRQAVALAAACPNRVFAAVGTHPHDADTLTGEVLAAERELIHSPGVVAIGEIGLDYYRNLSPQDAQRRALVAQLDLARALDLPVILHNRDSHADMIAHLRAHGQGLHGVFHCFIGDQAMARDALDLGFYLSFAGPVTYPKNTELAEVAAWAPLDRILVETDCPYLAPQPFRGKRNEPRHLALVAEHIAGLRGLSLDALATATTHNAMTLFRLPAAAPREDTTVHAPL